MEQGNFYSEVFLLENVDTLYFGNIKFYMESLVLDSITNLPCGISWLANSGDNTWSTGKTGCIRISGTPNDTVGQYKLGIYIHARVPALNTTLTGELSEIVQQLEGLIGGSLGIDYRYYVRVNQPNGACPNVVTSNPSLDRTASTTCSPDPNEFGVLLTDPVKRLCDGDSVDLDLQINNASNPIIVWDNGATLSDTSSASTTAFPDTVTYYTVSVTDSNGSGKTIYVRYTIDVADQLPDASFTVQQNGFVVGFTPAAAIAQSYDWNFGDGTTISTKQPIHTYQDNGSYTVTLTVVNVCGTETFSDVVEVNVVGVEEINAKAIDMTVFPNPATDLFVVSLDGSVDDNAILDLIDMQGRVVLSQNSFASKVIKVNTSGIEPGVYILRVSAANGANASQRLLITP